MRYLKPERSSDRQFCVVDIRLDKDSRVYWPEEKVTGSVVVEALQDCECRQLQLSYFWQTHGKGDRDKSRPHPVLLRNDEVWITGQRYTYSFEFPAPAPPFPFTYRGNNLNIDWYLEAKAELPWGISGLLSGQWRFSTCETEFLLEPASDRYQIEPSLFQDDVRYFTAFIGLSFVLVGIFALIYMVLRGATDGRLLVGFIIIGAGTLFSISSLPSLLAELRLGKVEVRLTPLGEERGLAGIVRVQPKRPVSVHAIIMHLGIEEHVTERIRSDRKSYKHTVFSDSVRETAASYRIPAVESEYTLKLALPGALPVTFEANSNEVVWTVTLSILLDRWFPWKKKIPLNVHY